MVNPSIEWFIGSGIFTVLAICTYMIWHIKFYLKNKAHWISAEMLWVPIVMFVFFAIIFFRIGIAKL